MRLPQLQEAWRCSIAECVLYANALCTRAPYATGVRFLLAGFAHSDGHRSAYLLSAAQRSIARGERKVVAIKEHAGQALHHVPDVKIEYFDLVDPIRFDPLVSVEGPVRAALAAWIGQDSTHRQLSLRSSSAVQ